MNRSLTNLWLMLACASLLLGESGCTPIGPLVSSTQFSQAAYDKDKELKNQTLELIDRAKKGTRYKNVSNDVDKLRTEIDSAIEFEQGRQKNAPTIGQWKIIKSKLVELFELWKTKGTLSSTFVEEAKAQISELFDSLIKTEEEKPRS